MIVVGGTYDEVCFEPKWDYKFGSGLRGVLTIHNINKSEPVKFYSFGNDNTILFVDAIKNDFLEPIIQEHPYSVSFVYDFPMSVPHIYPRLDKIVEQRKKLEIVENDNILYYGLLEAEVSVKGNKVVYDPQSPANPIPFSKTGSEAKELAIVTNYSEAKLLSGEKELSDIVKFFFEEEKVNVLVLKMGAKGALVYSSVEDFVTIPVYETEKVWPIGSGDVFAASFAYYWFKGDDEVKSAQKASWNTACYCNSKSYEFKPFENGDFAPLIMDNIPSDQIYLAGPFFTFTQRWLVNQIYEVLRGMGLKVFSPWHDIGHGEASIVVPLDLEGLDESKLVFAILDGLDSGTLFETGYAIAKGIDVIGYVENETVEDVKMLVGSECNLEGDLTTAIYKALWKLAK